MSAAPSSFTFTLGRDDLVGVKPFGVGGPPPDGYYEVKIDRMEPTDNPHSGKMILLSADGAFDSEVWSWWNLVAPNPGNDADIDKSNKNARRGQVSVLISLGYTEDQYEGRSEYGPVTEKWLLGRVAYISYVGKPQNAPQNVYPQVDFMPKDKYLEAKASGKPPTRRQGLSTSAQPVAPPATWTPPAAPPPPAGAAQRSAPPAPPAAPPAPPPVGAVAAPPAPPAPPPAPPPPASAPPGAGGRPPPPPPPPPR